LTPTSTEPAQPSPAAAQPQLLCCKSIDKLIADADEPGHRLEKKLGPWSLTALGIGAIIGSGIFVLTGTAAAGEHFEAPSILHAQVLDLLVNFLRTGSTAGALMHGRHFFLIGRGRVQLRRAVLRGTGVDDSDRGQRLHVFVRNAR
jgi:hypothetical protein